ncbi:PaaI family thioesterase [Aquirhabdus parva]|uniref:PaaI family thioesterase n=1 Tax=Aquirhabdus parva TaxID=2283318 RepID=A0A345PBS4_9GAMM|nr:PaaI family thioesterase [Aquirhabdus parva]AXI04733.1 PaaI family thioesterase [Aquirhabdus parva]
MDDLQAFAQTILKSQPFSQLLGAELIRFESGKAELALRLTDTLKQQHGFAHGGVVSYLADNALTFAGGSVLGDAVTSEFKINYLRPAIGERLIARAESLHAGKQQAVCKCEIYAVDAQGVEKLCAVAQGTIVKV